MAAKHTKKGDKEIGKEIGKGQGTESGSRLEPAVPVATVATKEAEQTSRLEPSPTQELRRSDMAIEGTNGERATEGYREIAKNWKDGYLQGLNLCLQWQEDNERLIRDSFKQSLSGSRQVLIWWKDWVEDQAQKQEEAQRQSSVTSPIPGLAKQSTGVVLAAIEPIFKHSETIAENSFGYYERSVAAPSRTYVREINKQVLNVMIPS
ncbi:MAG: hypothetical protein CV081_02825 [Nitrospira sp. LK265]|nr:hypothetical protein [Nitrospira sp. LK265]